MRWAKTVLLNASLAWLGCTRPATESARSAKGPPTVACLAGSTCTEVTLASGELPASLEAECAARNGRVVTACATPPNIGVCVANDVRIVDDVTDPKASLEARRSCSLLGGHFSPAMTTPPSGKDGPVLMSIEGLPLQVDLGDDCFTEEHGDIYVIGCGIGRRPATSLVASPYDGAPRSADGVVPFLSAQTRQMHVEERARRVERKEWRVEVGLVPKHGVAAAVFVQLRWIRGVPILCRGQAFDASGLREAEAMCDAIELERNDGQ